MDLITQTLQDYYTATFANYGATAKGVDWGDEQELLVRYDKMLAVLQKDFIQPKETPSLLDVGCGWGGLMRRIKDCNLPVQYTGIDVVESMIQHGRTECPNATFICGDVFDFSPDAAYDFVVCNAILTQRLSVSIPEMEAFSRRLIRRMFALCREGIAFNMMSSRVNYMVDNLFYQNPGELLSWLLTEISPRVRLDHGYSSLINGKGKFFDFTIYVYKG